MKSALSPSLLFSALPLPSLLTSCTREKRKRGNRRTENVQVHYFHDRPKMYKYIFTTDQKCTSTFSPMLYQHSTETSSYTLHTRKGGDGKQKPTSTRYQLPYDISRQNQKHTTKQTSKSPTQNQHHYSRLIFITSHTPSSNNPSCHYTTPSRSRSSATSPTSSTTTAMTGKHTTKKTPRLSPPNIPHLKTSPNQIHHSLSSHFYRKTPTVLSSSP